MKKILFTLTIMSLSLAGFVTVSAQYYDYSNYGNYSYDSYYTDTSYSSYSYAYPQTHTTHYTDSYRNRSKAGVGSYTIGCTTYYYNTRTGTQLYTENICNTYCTYQYPSTCQPTYTYPTTYTYPVQYTYPSYYYYNTPSYTYPSYGNYYYGTTQYCTYSYVNGAWYPSCGY